MDKQTKIELFTETDCCDVEASSSCCQDNQCECDVHVHAADTQGGKERAAQLKVTRFPAIAVNGQLLGCPAIEKAIANALCSKDANCCCC
ncbi:hypothetical protein [Pelagicoccus sp. SDUM812005]|uniref:hypothetical protein n=1 Tax=Pelagicoccus sp. SDUM812005 TaxID=3041257 RepID=UPI00280C4384|nr:hypothetical protein [Pelagicoccus sp. SDUM812005]MDQ8182997.1 hypothetical protein [Pelagicoccus sp. SDUM812005]